MTQRNKPQQRLCASALMLGILLSGCAHRSMDSASANGLDVAVAWKQTAAEYEALYYQAYNLARMQLQGALDRRQPGEPTLAVILDMDDTILDTRDYWAQLLKADQDFFDDQRWDDWIPQNRVRAAPGALDFLQFCAANQVEVFYITSRNQGDPTYQYALAHLIENGFPNADTDHLTVLTDSSNKQIRQAEIASSHNVVLLMGDNLNDFSRAYYVDGVAARKALLQQDRDLFGSRYILLPNPTDGHWVRAIFGDSEPLPSNDNRRQWHDAATGNQP
ncbi:MAG: HAD family acid phosphatase [SAR86 cluster bacterium]|jgi:5'-nucleotidase (lipoprotein e(P4) family)